VPWLIHIWAPWLTNQLPFFIYVPWLIDMYTFVPWLIYVCAINHTYLGSMTHFYIYICAMIHLYLCHDSFIYGLHDSQISCKKTGDEVAIYIHMCHDSFTYVPWLIYICAMTHLYVCHDSFIYVPWLHDSQISCKKTGDEVAGLLFKMPREFNFARKNSLVQLHSVFWVKWWIPCIYICVCVCVYIYVHMYTYKYNVCMYKYVCTYIRILR